LRIFFPLLNRSKEPGRLPISGCGSLMGHARPVRRSVASCKSRQCASGEEAASCLVIRCGRPDGVDSWGELGAGCGDHLEPAGRDVRELRQAASIQPCMPARVHSHGVGSRARRIHGTLILSLPLVIGKRPPVFPRRQPGQTRGCTAQPFPRLPPEPRQTVEPTAVKRHRGYNW